MADLHESHEEQVERTVSSTEAVTEYLNCYVRPYRNEISFAIRNGAYSLSGRYFLGLCDGGQMAYTCQKPPRTVIGRGAQRWLCYRLGRG